MKRDQVIIEKDCDQGVESRSPDAELIRRLQQGDIEALGKLFETHKALVYRTALGILRDARAAEDILQEVFVRLYTYAASIDPERSFKPWLYRVTVNLSYDWSSKKSPRPLNDMLEWLSGVAGGFPAPDRSTDEKETARMVREVIAELPTTHRAVIVLFYMENLSVEEISRVLDLPPGTVKSRLHYARKRLRELLIGRQRLVPEMTYEFT